MAETGTTRRRRSSSILQVYHEPPETVEQLSDRAALPNGNANWVNAKGEAFPAWIMQSPGHYTVFRGRTSQVEQEG